MKMLQVGGHPFYYRESFGDKLIVRENLGPTNQYHREVPLLPNDIVLDLGAHIGAYTVYAAGRVAQVISVEPEPSNFRVLTRNTKHLENVRIVNAAGVGGTGGSKTTLYVNGRAGGNSGANSLDLTRGRRKIQVHAVPFTGLSAGVTVIKCDIEGGEYDLLDEFADLPKTMRLVAMELHFHRRPIWRFELAPRLVSSLETQFSTIRPIVWPKGALFSKVGVWGR